MTPEAILRSDVLDIISKTATNNTERMPFAGI